MRLLFNSRRRVALLLCVAVLAAAPIWRLSQSLASDVEEAAGASESSPFFGQSEPLQANTPRTRFQQSSSDDAFAPSTAAPFQQPKQRRPQVDVAPQFNLAPRDPEPRDLAPLAEEPSLDANSSRWSSSARLNDLEKKLSAIQQEIESMRGVQNAAAFELAPETQPLKPASGSQPLIVQTQSFEMNRTTYRLDGEQAASLEKFLQTHIGKPALFEMTTHSEEGTVTIVASPAAQEAIGGMIALMKGSPQSPLPQEPPNFPQEEEETRAY